jgi:hypothetical protein
VATNPPIVIGPFSNVPAPGSGVSSDWAQTISHYVTEQLAGGRKGAATMAANQTGIAAAETALTGSSITFTAVAGRRYRLEYTFGAEQVTAPGAQIFRWRLGGVSTAIIDYENAAVGIRMVSGFIELGVLGAGSKTIDLTGSTSAGSMNIPSGTAVGGRVAVVDVGI